jgi:arabinofuranosyltransferase
VLAATSATPFTRRLAIGLVVVPIVVTVALAWRHRFMSDDGFINLRILDNLRHGFGPVFNVDERVEAYTSPLWLGILWLGSVFLPFLSLENVAMVLGVGLFAAALIAATVGAWRLWDRSSNGLPVPFAALALMGLVPFWDYATSGLDTALSLCWLGVCFLALTYLLLPSSRPTESGETPTRARRWKISLGPAGVAAIVGLGPLVRPDLSIFAAGFIVVLLLTTWRTRGRRALTLLLWAAAIPLLYELFRMGYFAALVPNTAIAKQADQANWARGWFYLGDLVGTYWLWVPLLIIGAAVALLLWRGRGAQDRGVTLLVGVTAGCSLLHALYVVRVGGDFMHARMLLPSVFGFSMSALVVRIPARKPAILAVVAIGIWSIVAMTTLRPHNSSQPFEIENLRENFVAATRDSNPVALQDFRGLSFLWLEYGEGLRARSDRPQIIHPRAGDLFHSIGRPARSSRTRVFATAEAVGIIGYAAGPAVHVVDLHGLSDPLASRLPITSDHKAGHEKLLDLEWVVGRFADPGTSTSAVDASSVAAARAVLSCDSLNRLLTAITAPMSLHRFVTNIGEAWDSKSLRVPQRADADADGRNCP